MKHLKILIASTIFAAGAFAQSAPAFRFNQTNLPITQQYCQSVQNVGSIVTVIGIAGGPQTYLCQQTGASSLGQGAFAWQPLQVTTTAGGGILIVAAGKTATLNNSITFSGTDSTTMTLPGASDTLVGLAASQTLTNKTLTNPVITGPAPVACGATCTASVPNATYLLNQAAGSTATLPTSAGTGNTYKFLITVATTSAQEKILLTTVTDTIIGTAIGENGGTAKVFVGNAGTYHSIQMPFAGTQPSGGFIGDSIACTDIATGTWQCQVIFQGGTTPTTPYSSSTT